MRSASEGALFGGAALLAHLAVAAALAPQAPVGALRAEDETLAFVALGGGSAHGARPAIVVPSPPGPVAAEAAARAPSVGGAASPGAVAASRLPTPGADAAYEPAAAPAPRHSRLSRPPPSRPGADSRPATAAPTPAAPASARAGPAPEVAATELLAWGSAVRSRIEMRARALVPAGLSGRVVLRLDLGADGSLRGAGLLRASGRPALDRAALAAIEASQPFPPGPGSFRGIQRFDLPVRVRP